MPYIMEVGMLLDLKKINKFNMQLRVRSLVTLGI